MNSFRSEAGQVDEWVVIELQGSLESAGSQTGLSGRDVGTLSYTKEVAYFVYSLSMVQPKHEQHFIFQIKKNFASE